MSAVGQERLALFKRLAEGLAVAIGLDAIARAVRRNSTLVLAYHNIVPAGERQAGDRSLHLPQHAFAAQLDLLLRTHDIVPLNEAVTTAGTGRPRAVLTFDDAYVGAVTVGLGEVGRRGLPATVFVAPGILGSAMWWDLFADQTTGGVDAGFRGRALGEFCGRDGEVRAAAVLAGLKQNQLPDWARIATGEQLITAAAQPGVSLGSHSWSHANLAALEGAELQDELIRPLQWLRGSGARLSPWLAYPYGLATAATATAARQAGYEGAMLVSGGLMAADMQPAQRYMAPRYNVPSGLSQNAFRLRAAGVRRP